MEKKRGRGIILLFFPPSLLPPHLPFFCTHSCTLPGSLRDGTGKQEALHESFPLKEPHVPGKSPLSLSLSCSKHIPKNKKKTKRASPETQTHLQYSISQEEKKNQKAIFLLAYLNSTRPLVIFIFAGKKNNCF